MSMCVHSLFYGLLIGVFLWFPVLMQLMSLPTITNLTATRLGRYHLALAVVIILKNATSLRLSNLSPKSALTHAELHYQEANIDSKIRQLLTASSSQEHSVELFSSFIMAMDVYSDENTCAPT
ncbi:hypothetical protein H4582DRAFT_1342458 [Lactarius indigo]|nr:hypothetical protein H4582DRAFT_1342458 [Lactarius indigo]